MLEAGTVHPPVIPISSEISEKIRDLMNRSALKATPYLNNRSFEGGRRSVLGEHAQFRKQCHRAAESGARDR